MMKKNPNFLKWIATRPEGRAFLLDSSDDGFSYDDYVAFCEINDLTPRGEDSEDFFRWKRDECAINFDEDLAQLKGSRHLKGPVVVTGTVGRWNGSFDIVPEVFPSFADAYKKIAGRDILDIRASYDTRCIHVEAAHHDATNLFQVWILKGSADRDQLQRRIDDGAFYPEKGYDRRFIQDITDYLI